MKSKLSTKILKNYATQLMTKKAMYAAAIALLATNVDAQKKPLDLTVFDEWQSIGMKELSNNGSWVAYQVNAQESDNTLNFFGLKTDKNLSFHRGEQSVFTADSKFAVFKIRPFYKDLKLVRIKKKKEHEIAKDSIGILNLATNQVEKLPNIKSFKTPKKGGSFLAYLLEKEEAKNDKKDKSDSTKTKDKPSKPAGKDKKDTPLELVLRNLISGQKKSFKNVMNYEFSENGKQLIFSTKQEKKDSLDKTKYGVFLVNTVTFAQKQLVDTIGDFKQFAFDELANKVAFVGTSDEEKKENKTYYLYYSATNNPQQIKKSELLGLKKDWQVSENRQPKFSKDGNSLFIGLMPKLAEKDTTLIADDYAKVDVWSYKDDFIQPQQLKNLEREKKRSYLSVIDLSNPVKVTQLADLDMNQVEILNEGNSNFALGTSDNAYRLSSNWDVTGRKDYYIINTKTGQRELFAKALAGRVEMSPNGKFAVFYNAENGLWSSYNIETKEKKVLNKKLKVKFYDEENDSPTLAQEYGVAYFTDNDETVLIKDRYDIWEFDLVGNRRPENMTNGFGRKHNITFDINQLNDDIKTLNRDNLVYLGAFNNQNKQSGVYQTIISKAKNPEEVVMSNTWGAQKMTKALNANEFIYTKESFRNSPDVYVSTNFKDEKKISAINPQQKDYLWGNGELVTWKTYSGKDATGVVYKPENFDPNKKYPMIVYFYEKLSDNLNRYQAPAPTPSRINHTYFVSNDYIVFTPDISYTIGHPGKSAEDYINSGVEALKKNTWVNGSKIAIQGQSWGGYQVAHLITATNMYAAAWTGAPVVNMTSAYGGIRWGTGMSRQFQYEQTQSRIGKTLWEAPELYIENSPLFNMPKVTTPVVIMHNDEDGAVPWYQGIEMFMALRRLGKPVWMLNYNGDDHNLIKRANKNDIQQRQVQFFDHYLKDKPAPKWMTEGVSAINKGIDWGFELESVND
ncbi:MULTISPECIES: alpha/beta hydrolase family protein [Empedobacter]|uniref:alpha/beta hydrolase family protein n=1 Tax=Empedobacter TaxID=59734 RepID=UPI002577D666|nr:MULTISPECIES: prolyl oligopeptidase family serine peptidase [Empedobacter]MDM1041936.1 S9 family peptidase [Empedobacter brevis]MDM1135867.1 S9 family peptidase [Empedobacter sp. R750]